MSHDAWFAVLPDAEACAGSAAALGGSGSRRLDHASGRPLLLGDWPSGEVKSARAGTATVAVIGRCPVTATELAERVARDGDVSAVDRLGRTLPGCFHLVVAINGWVRVQGTLAGVRRVYRTSVDGATIASDRADVLAGLNSAAVDEQALALRLLHPTITYPLDERPLFLGVDLVPQDSYLLLGAEGHMRTVRRWRPPEVHVPLAQGVRDIREALVTAVRARTAGAEVISSDLSGGFDSSTLCFLAAREPVELITTRWKEIDPSNDDAYWAERAAAQLPRARHVVVGRDDGPSWYAEFARHDEPAEEPYRWARGRFWVATLATRMRAEGSLLHLGGHGGDELFLRTGGYLHDLIRRQPYRAIGRIRRHRSAGNWPFGASVRALADRRGFAAWLRDSIDTLTDPPASPSHPSIPWGGLIRLPPWATARAREAVAEELLRLVVDDVAPLSARRGQHHTLEMVRTGGQIVRQINRVSAWHDLPLDAPFLDDLVVEAALAVSPYDRNQPTGYKPLLAAAVRGIVPEEILTRTTKGDFGREVYAGIHRHLRELTDLTEDSLLAERGLIDADLLRRELSTSHVRLETLSPLEPTLASEVWLRGLASHPTLARLRTSSNDAAMVGEQQ